MSRGDAQALNCSGVVVFLLCLLKFFPATRARSLLQADFHVSPSSHLVERIIGSRIPKAWVSVKVLPDNPLCSHCWVYLWSHHW